MKSFKHHITEKRNIQDLIEKQIIVGKGARQGQIVFLAGGAGSGKGFARNNFLEGEKFKVRDVDELKKAFLILAKTKDKYKEIRGLDLRRTKDVMKMHMFIKNKGIQDKTLDLLLQGGKLKHLPNILIDTTLAEAKKVDKLVPQFMASGYDPKNIHIVWVLTNYSIAVKQNRNPERGRIVPEDILLATHEGAANTMWNFIRKGTPRGVDGGVYIVLGGPEHTVLWEDKEGKPIKTGKKKDTVVVKDFKYLVMKEPGKSMTKEKDLLGQALSWIRTNVPKSTITKNLFGTGQKKE